MNQSKTLHAEMFCKLSLQCSYLKDLLNIMSHTEVHRECLHSIGCGHDPTYGTGFALSNLQSYESCTIVALQFVRHCAAADWLERHCLQPPFCESIDPCLTSCHSQPLWHCLRSSGSESVFARWSCSSFERSSAHKEADFGKHT